MFGSHAASPWVMKNVPIPSNMARRTPGLASNARAAAVPRSGAVSSTSVPTGSLGARPLTSIQTNAATRLSAASNTSTDRQSPNTGSSTEFVRRSANTPPSAGADV